MSSITDFNIEVQKAFFGINSIFNGKYKCKVVAFDPVTSLVSTSVNVNLSPNSIKASRLPINRPINLPTFKWVSSKSMVVKLQNDVFKYGLQYWEVHEAFIGMNSRTEGKYKCKVVAFDPETSLVSKSVTKEQQAGCLSIGALICLLLSE